MSTPIQQEFDEKEKRIHHYLDEHKLDAIVIGTQANFSWLSCGGRSNVLITSELSDALIVVTRTTKTLIAFNMDGDRNRDEEMTSLGFDLIMTHWNEKSREEVVLKLLEGKIFLADIPLEGAIFKTNEFYNLIYPLTEWEITRYRQIAKESELTLREVADKVFPGMTELDVEKMVVSDFAMKGFVSTVVLIGSDERILKYRHPIPSTKNVKDTLLLVLCPRKYGLHVPITRMVSFNENLDSEMERRFEAASTIAANCISMSTPGIKFADILVMQKRLYKELGYENEWKNHFQGGLTGYIPNDSSLCLETDAVIKENQTFNWFITITGVNTEDTIISGKEDILTQSGNWPRKKFQTCGREISMPIILKR